MNDRIHEVLDGDLPRSALSPIEELELREMEEAIAATGHLLRERPLPDLTARVMAALPPVEAAGPARGKARNPFAALVAWVWTPRPMTLRPATGLGFGFAVALALLLVGRADPEPSPATAALEPVAAAPVAPMYIQFRLDASNVSDVALAGSFTEWEPSYTLHETAPGVWTVLVPLEPGVHDYLFVVDGEEWVADPTAQPVADGFGGTNSRLLLVPPSQEA